MLHRSLSLLILTAAFVGLPLLGGCAEARKPQLVIAPNYSFTQAGVELTTVETAVPDQRSAMADRLPPLPAAPGFD